jgi:hypothetical protein
VEEARKLKPGTRLLLRKYRVFYPKILDNLLSRVVSKQEAKKLWMLKNLRREGWVREDVFFFYAPNNMCHSLVKFGRLTFDEVYAFEEHELEKVKLLMNI